MQLRPYQIEAKQAACSMWAMGLDNVMLVYPTGSGKTVIMGSIVQDHNGYAVAIAHRQELVTQISTALAREGVRHTIIGPSSVVKECVRIHMDEVGRSYYDPNAQTAVAGVDTLVKRKEQLADWCNRVTLWLIDECHHVSSDGSGKLNKWGEAAAMFPNAKGLGVTATPLRADGRGLGRHSDGLFDAMHVGPTMRDLINSGSLTEYRIFAPPSDIDLSQVNISKATGDYNKNQVVKAVRKSHIVGDVVTHYQRIASGKLGVTFATDVETATDIAERFKAAGVPAAVVSAKTPALERAALLRRFKNREIMQLVNVDLFGEGFDLPAIEVVSMARPTQSYGLYAQQFGRVLRLLDGKTHGLVIDHVGNVTRHGLPDAPREWSLDRRERRARSSVSDAIPVATCRECAAVYERIYKVCPECGFAPQPSDRSAPEQVDGDLVELDAATLAAMRGDADRAVKTDEELRLEMIGRRVPGIGQAKWMKHRQAGREAQEQLREAISWWGGHQRAAGRDDSESYRLFYHRFGVDVLSAQAYETKQAQQLTQRIQEDYKKWIPKT